MTTPKADPKRHEQRFMALWQAYAPADLRDPVAQVGKLIPGRQYRVDFYWPEFRLIVEIDGGAWIKAMPGGAHGHDKDRERSNLFVTHGYRILRYSGRMLRGDGGRECIMQIVLFMRKEQTP